MPDEIDKPGRGRQRLTEKQREQLIRDAITLRPYHPKRYQMATALMEQALARYGIEITRTIAQKIMRKALVRLQLDYRERRAEVGCDIMDKLDDLYALSRAAAGDAAIRRNKEGSPDPHGKRDPQFPQIVGKCIDIAVAKADIFGTEEQDDQGERLIDVRFNIVPGGAPDPKVVGDAGGDSLPAVDGPSGEREQHLLPGGGDAQG